jgi:hypothetical protein
MQDTATFAHRRVAGGDLYLRRASGNDLWEISRFDSFTRIQPVGNTGIAWTATLVGHAVLERTFATPEEAALAVQQAIA